MSKKLLHTTLTTYLVCFLLILAVSAPLFYYVTERLYREDADETLRLHKKEFETYTAPLLTDSEVSQWNKFNRDIRIEKATMVTTDSIYRTVYYDTLEAELEPYRELIGTVYIQNKPYKYKARVNLVESEDLVKSLAWLFTAMIFFLLAVLFVITRRLSIRLWKPFYETLKKVEDFEIDKSQPPLLTATGTWEFDRLNASIRKLVDKNTSIYKRQNEFIENAAHELQTPLAVLQVKMDTFMQQPGFTAEQSNILPGMRDAVSRLQRLNKNLLLLSKIENEHYNQRIILPLKDCVLKNINFFAEQATAKNITIQTQLGEGVEICSNAALAEILISNLFLNAVRHNFPGGTIEVHTSGRQLIFSNTGAQQPLDAEKLFQRFSKLDPSGEGTGLGLSIVKKIADANQWKIDYKYSGGTHFFILSF